MLTPEEAKAILILLTRVQLSFNEAHGAAQLKNKLTAIANPKEPGEEGKED